MKTESSNFDLEKISFAEVSLDISGDVTVAQVIRDSANNIYAALLVSDPGKAEGFTLLKLDPQGKELWRFPTKAAAQSTNDASKAVTAGKFVKMQLSGDGKLFVMSHAALRANIKDSWSSYTSVLPEKFKFITQIANPNSTPELKEISAIFATATRLVRIDATGNSADSPLMELSSHLLTPATGDAKPADTNVKPNANVELNGFNILSDGKLLLEASSVVGDSSIQIKQVVTANLKSTSEAVCFVSPQITASSALDSHVIVKQTIRKPESGPSITDNLNNNCWDLLEAKPFSNPDKFKKVVPSTIDSGNEVWELDVLTDLLRTENKFEATKVRNLELTPSAIELVSAKNNPDRAKFQNFASLVFGTSPLFMGDVKVSDDGDKQYSLANQLASDTTNWLVKLPTSSVRKPESMNLSVTGDNALAVMSWTDLHPDGETRAGTSSVRVATLDLKKPTQNALKTKSFAVPQETGLATFTSVASCSENGKLAILATGKAENAKSSSLLIGLPK